MNITKKKTALLALALALCIGIASAAVWLLTVHVSITYEEALIIYHTDEFSNFTSWSVIDKFPCDVTTGTVHIDDYRFGDWYVINNTGARDVGLRVQIQAFFANGTPTDLIGFNVTELAAETIPPENITLNYIYRGNITASFIVPKNTVVEAKMFYELILDAPTDEAFEAVWTVERFEPPLA